MIDFNLEGGMQPEVWLVEDRDGLVYGYWDTDWFAHAIADAADEEDEATVVPLYRSPDLSEDELDALGAVLVTLEVLVEEGVVTGVDENLAIAKFMWERLQ